MPRPPAPPPASSLHPALSGRLSSSCAAVSLHPVHRYFLPSLPPRRSRSRSRASKAWWQLAASRVVSGDGELQASHPTWHEHASPTAPISTLPPPSAQPHTPRRRPSLRLHSTAAAASLASHARLVIDNRAAVAMIAGRGEVPLAQSREGIAVCELLCWFVNEVRTQSRKHSWLTLAKLCCLSC
ncbi:unnamed protein product [Urochloa decumbens]|uniref:Uncharacterized protein n=1 Tax=Urochloa decumbens TaxID=240449 RepID=A0ABC8VIU7_9POAL